MRRASRWEAAIAALVLLVSLGARLARLDYFRVNDESHWMCRIVTVRAALQRGDWAGTFVTGHPGVVTTWIGVIFAPPNSEDVRVKCLANMQSMGLHETSLSQEDWRQTLVALNTLLFRARIGVALFTWACIVGIYFLTRLLWGPKVALLSGVLVALDPFYLALSRFLHLDAVATSTMAVSLLALLVSLDRARSLRSRLAFVALSGAFGGLSMLQKSPAMSLPAFVAAAEAFDLLRGLRGGQQQQPRRRLLCAVRDLMLWGLLAGAVYAAVWPSMWVRPFWTVAEVLKKAMGYAVAGHESGSYFFGQAVHDPGWLYYPVTVALRLAPLACVGLVAAVIGALRRGRPCWQRFGVGMLLLYCAYFTVFMGLGSKKFDRYLLPVYPALDIAAAMGLLWLCEAIGPRLKGAGRWLQPHLALGVVGVVIQIVPLAVHYPYYLTFYNPLLGGIRQAQKVILVGWGEGYERAAQYLNSQPGVERTQASELTATILAPWFEGETRRMRNYAAWDDEYVLFYVSHIQRRHFDNLLAEFYDDPAIKPEHVVRLHGVDFVTIYRNNQHYLAPMAYLEQHARPGEGDCMVVNGDSLFAENYTGQLPTYAFGATYLIRDSKYDYWDAEQMAGLLDAAAPTCRRLWYVQYPEWEPPLYSEMLRRRGVLLEKTAFPHMELSLYELAGADEANRAIGAAFGALQLVSYGVTEPPPARGGEGGVLLTWRAAAQPDRDYVLSMQVYDARGERIAQLDTPLLDGALRPTSQWQAGATSALLYRLPLAAGAPPGDYALEVGLIDPETGERLELNGTAGETVARLTIAIGGAARRPTLAELGAPPVPVRTLAPGLRLLSARLDTASASAGATVTLRLFWEALAPMAEPYRLELAVQGADGQVHGGGQVALLNTDYPTTAWRVGERLSGALDLSLGAGTPSGEMQITLNVLDAGGQPVLPAPVALARIGVQAAAPAAALPAHARPLEATLGEEARLLGYELSQAPLAPGASLYVTLYWSALRPIERGYKVFVHVYDAAGNLAAQQDGLPGLGALPTPGWAPGAVVSDLHLVPLPEELPEGIYRIAVGLYDEESATRLAAVDAGGQRLENDRIFVGQVQVVAQP